uniref:Retrotransposon Copia-like N-terminal domain-containing protein n=1 Tax=Populus alba TaxID=43335 RepID=A0A4U5QIH2_POPAL|nr:hypothetical protein D5086_0000083040 [Populus alba]
MSTSLSSSTTAALESSLPIFNPSSSIKITKLTRLNFPTWKATPIPCLKSQKVYGYIDGTMQQPARTITTSTGSTISNSSFDIRETEDNLIIIYLNSSLSDEVLA